MGVRQSNFIISHQRHDTEEADEVDEEQSDDEEQSRHREELLF